MIRYDFNIKSERDRFYRSGAWRGPNGARAKALKRANNECEWCRAEGKFNNQNLECDHIKELEYCSYSEAIDLDNLRILCKYHHNMRHERFEHSRFKFKRKENKFNDEKW